MVDPHPIHEFPGRTDTLMWGRSYLLEMEENNNRKIYWTPLKAVTPYTWYRHALGALGALGEGTSDMIELGETVRPNCPRMRFSPRQVSLVIPEPLLWHALGITLLYIS